LSYNPSDLLRLYVIDAQTEEDSWAPLTNTNLDRVEQAIHGQTALTLSGLDVTLDDTIFTGTQAHRHMLVLSGTMVQSCTITVPTRDHTYFVWNRTTAASGGPYTVSIAAVGQSTGIPTVAHGERAIVVVSGGVVSSFYHNVDFLPANGGALAGALNMNSHQINNLSEPTSTTDAVTKNYVETRILNILGVIFHIGKILITLEPANPSTYLGFGTWRLYGTGRCLMSAGTATDTRGEIRSIALAENVGGEFQHVLNIPEMPPHAHKQGSESLFSDYGGGTLVNNSRTYAPGGLASYRNQQVSITGEGGAHNNMPPGFSAYVWVRTA